NEQGGWHNSNRALHRWQVEDQVANAYIVWALSEAGLDADFQLELEQAVKVAKAKQDPYQLALLANALHARGDARANQLMQLLLPQQAKDGSWTGQTRSMTMSSGKNLQIETTALVVMAIARTQAGIGQLKQALQFITASKSQYGFGSTQSTVLAMKALIAAAKYQQKNWEKGHLVVSINGKKVAQQKYKRSDQSPIHFADLGRHFKLGQNQVAVQFADQASVLAYDLKVKYQTRQPDNSEKCQVELSTELATQTAQVGDQVRLTVNLRNPSTEVLPNTIAKVGIPAGLSVQAWQLEELAEKGIFDYYELFDGYLVFHYRNLSSKFDQAIALDLKADLPGRYEAPASQAYLYYTNEDRVWARPANITIEK
ncbi:MAG: hypothetical protein AAGD05_05075, partial [Bacteroidota bacterium]